MRAEVFGVVRTEVPHSALSSFTASLDADRSCKPDWLTGR